MTFDQQGGEIRPCRFLLGWNHKLGMDRNKILFQKCISLRTPQKAAVQQPAAGLLHLQTFLALRAECTGHVHRIWTITCSLSWVLMLKLRCKACSGRTFLYDLGEALPWLQTWLSPPAKQGTATPTRGVWYEVCPVRVSQMGGCFRVSLPAHATAHPGQCVSSSLPLHEGSRYRSGTPEHGLCTSAASGQSTEPELAAEAVRVGTLCFGGEKRLAVRKQALALFIYRSNVSFWDWDQPMCPVVSHQDPTFSLRSQCWVFGAFQTLY